MTAPSNKWAGEQMPRLRQQFGNRCAICGCGYEPLPDGKPNLQFAHTKPTGVRGSGRGRKKRIHDIRKHPEAYRLLCVDCHIEADALYREVHGKSVNNDMENLCT